MIYSFFLIPLFGVILINFRYSNSKDCVINWFIIFLDITNASLNYHPRYFQEIEKEDSVVDGLSTIYEKIHTFLHHYLDSFNDEEKVGKYLTIFARYKLGFQIKHVLEKEGSDSCFVSCEC